MVLDMMSFGLGVAVTALVTGGLCWISVRQERGDEAARQSRSTFGE
jgi:hypothetical protein